jgi:sodium-dependent phosphate cotransporter
VSRRSPRRTPTLSGKSLARIAAERKWVVAVYLISVFIVLPALVIILVGVL